MIDWKNIKEKYPKAYEKFIHEWYHGYKDLINERDLYDFFDEQGINILITCEFDFGYEILDNRYEVNQEVKKWFNSRQEAESEVFTKAFEILNDKLKTKWNG